MGYRDPPPWVFEGKALYQLNLVRTEDARAHVPKDLRLVECFGYTLGGLYVARYDESPCGKLDEVVVLGGLVWNPPTSCAWASRVYVDSAEARAHGIRTCGLPSRVATFKEERGRRRAVAKRRDVERRRTRGGSVGKETIAGTRCRSLIRKNACVDSLFRRRQSSRGRGSQCSYRVSAVGRN